MDETKNKGQVKMFFFWFHSFFLFFLNTWNGHGHIRNFLTNISILKEILFVHFLLVVLMVVRWTVDPWVGVRFPPGRFSFFLYMFWQVG